MKFHRYTRTAILGLATFLFQTDRFMAFAANVPPGMGIFAFDPTARSAFQDSNFQARSDQPMSCVVDYCLRLRTMHNSATEVSR